VAQQTYRIRLERESDQKTICQWGNITEDRIKPMLHTLRGVIPYIAHAGRARRAWSELLSALGG
jgi:hypothetical protein